jgi:tRNA(fMet)-specific endonuclease VapC
VAIALLAAGEEVVRGRFEAARASGTQVDLSMMVYHELMYGAAHSQRRKANEDKIALFVVAGRLNLLAFEEGDARKAADIRAHLRRQGSPIGPFDILIAAQARRVGARLNGREFARDPGLAVVDWGRA